MQGFACNKFDIYRGPIHWQYANNYLIMICLKKFPQLLHFLENISLPLTTIIVFGTSQVNLDLIRLLWTADINLMLNISVSLVPRW
jgi:hypothetical protein